MPTVRLTKAVVQSAAPQAGRYVIYDTVVPGFGLRVFPSGKKTWVLEYRPGEGGRRAPVRRLKIGALSQALPLDAARREAERLKALVSLGADPQHDLSAGRAAPTVDEIARAFLTDHVEAKRTASTKRYYESILKRLILPAFGTMKAKDLKSADVARLHRGLRSRPFLANRVLAIIGAMYSFAEGAVRLVPKGINPVIEIEKYEEPKRQRLLSAEELGRLAAALVEAETTGLPWALREGAKHKHLPKEPAGRLTKLAPSAVAAVRLLLFTGARLREILHLRWDQIDLDRGMAVLLHHKTSRRTGAKAIVLNGPAIGVLRSIERVGTYVIQGSRAGLSDEQPRADLKRPWAMITKRAGLDDLRIHDLRHNFASFGVGGGLGLPIVGKLLGHVQASTTQRYGHLDNDPLQRASNAIGSAIVDAMQLARSTGEASSDSSDNACRSEFRF